MPEALHTPVWAREDAFPIKPGTGVFGFQDSKGRQIHCSSEEELCEAIASSRYGIDLAWWPENERMQVPAELPFLRLVLANRQVYWARKDLSDGKRMGALFGVFVLWSLYAAFSRSGGDWSKVIESTTLGIGVIFWLTLGLIPLYEGWKGLRKSVAEDWVSEIKDARFETWLLGQRAPFTMALLVLMIVTGIGQFYLSHGFGWAEPTLEKVGLLKMPIGSADGEWWRFFTSTLVHGNIVHWLMNAAALRYLARRVEVMAGWPHLVMVFVLSALMGAYASARWVPEVPSLGASGGILGLLGFLLIFESLHCRLVPVSARRRLLAGVAMVAVMGVVGFSFIDNAAHAGGLLVGLVYAVIVFPSSKSVEKPMILASDIIAGCIAGLVLLASAAWCLLRLVGG